MKRKIDYAWCISLFVVGIATVILNGSNLVGIDLPDWLTRSLGIIDLVAVFVCNRQTCERLYSEKRV